VKGILDKRTRIIFVFGWDNVGVGAGTEYGHEESSGELVGALGLAARSWSSMPQWLEA